MPSVASSSWIVNYAIMPAYMLVAAWKSTYACNNVIQFHALLYAGVAAVVVVVAVDYCHALKPHNTTAMHDQQTLMMLLLLLSS